MAVDIPSLDVLMDTDIDQLHELEVVECPPALEPDCCITLSSSIPMVSLSGIVINL
jgi:hypothetical protein